MSTGYQIGIILVNYKHYCDRFLADARNTLRKQTYPKDLFKVYIIDNVSTAESFNKLQEMYPEAAVVATQGNGWGHANNLGMKMAWHDGCDAAALVNMDTEFDENWLTELVDAAYSDNKIGITQAKIMLWELNHKKSKINSVGNLMHYLGFSFCDGYKQENEKTVNQEIKDIYSASGASMLIKRNVAELIGGCDEEYFMYHDDLELSLKARLAGFRIVLAPQSIMYHKYEFGRSIKQVYYMERNRYLTMNIFYSWRTRLLLLPATFVMDIGMWFYALVKGWAGAKFRVFVYFLKPSTAKHIREQRKKLKKIRTIKDRELLNDAVGKVEFQEIDNPVLKYIANPILNAYWRLVKKLIIW